MEDQEGKLKKEAFAFKAYLLKSNSEDGSNLYDHLTDVLAKVMEERPDNPLDVFEQMSLDLKETSFKGTESTLRNLPDPPAASELEQQSLLFSSLKQPHQNEIMINEAFQNLNEHGLYLEQAGVGLCREEMQRIFIAVSQLVEQEEPQQCRLWGKILGRESNYIVVEADYKEEDWQDQSTEEDTEEEDTAGQEDDQLPQSIYKSPPQVPKEPIGTGANKCVYYVCNKPGLPWVKLPPVTPAEITVARQIYKYFTGRLDAPVLSYPPFPGNEANYLRAQIARISAGTQVSPRGFYQLKEEESDSETEAAHDDLEINPNYEGIPAGVMVEDLSAWEHCTHHILPQGRCTWVDVGAGPKSDQKEEEEDEEEDDNEVEIPEREEGPPILTPLSQDAEMFNTPPWSCRLSTTLTPQHAIAVLSSNLWSGAHAYASGRKHGNIYIGWGLKWDGEGYSPPVPPPPQPEYSGGPEVTEALDPSAEEEKTLKGLKEQQPALEEEESEKEESENGEEESEDED